MDAIAAKFTVYYRELPTMLETVIKTDGNMSIIKDGAKKISETSKAPRITIVVSRKEKEDPRKRVDNLIKILENLASNNQIISFNKVA